MTYDFDGLTDHSAPTMRTGYVPHPQDLEAIVTLMQLGAIWLTPSPGTTFTFEELFAQMRELGGDEIVVSEKDVRIVLPYSSFLRKEPGKRFSLK